MTAQRSSLSSVSKNRSEEDASRHHLELDLILPVALIRKFIESRTVYNALEHLNQLQQLRSVEPLEDYVAVVGVLLLVGTALTMYGSYLADSIYAVFLLPLSTFRLFPCS